MAMVAAGAASYAQIGQGTLMLGGSLGFNSTGEQTTTITNPSAPDVKTPSFSNWNFSPRVGYFLADNLAVGIDLSLGQTYRGTATSGSNNENYSSFDLGIGVFGRYYVGISDNFYFFGQANIGYTTSSWTERVGAGGGGFQDDDKNTVSGFNVGIAPGLTFFPSAKWGVDLTLNQILGLRMSTSKVETPADALGNQVSDTETKRTDFNIGLGLMPTLGLHYYMGR